MKRKIIKFERFLVWVFHFELAGEKKVLRVEEITRNLDLPESLKRELAGKDLTKIRALNSISIFPKGDFIEMDKGKSFPISEGSGGWRYKISERFEGSEIIALQPNSEYHCILPRDPTATFWERRVTKFEGCINSTGPGYVYVARGSIHVDEVDVKAEELVKITGEKRIWCTSLEPAVVAEMWR